MLVLVLLLESLHFPCPDPDPANILPNITRRPSSLLGTESESGAHPLSISDRLFSVLIPGRFQAILVTCSRGKCPSC
jgi:hypothetical protein